KDLDEQKALARRLLTGQLSFTELKQEVRRQQVATSAAAMSIQPAPRNSLALPPFQPDSTWVEPPFMPQLRRATLRNHVVLRGPAGGGKSLAVQKLAAECGRPLFFVAGHSDLTIEE